MNNGKIAAAIYIGNTLSKVAQWLVESDRREFDSHDSANINLQPL